MTRLLFTTTVLLMAMTACAPTTMIPMTYTSSLINAQDQQILFLVNDQLVNVRGDSLAHFEGKLLKNHINQTIGSVDGAAIHNLQGQLIGRIEGSELVSAIGRSIMRVEGGTPEEQAKVGAGYFFFFNDGGLF